MLTRANTYEDLIADFAWAVPAQFNIGADVADRPAAEGAGLALIHLEPDGSEMRLSFADISRLSNQLANLLAVQGIRRGDRVAVLLGQRPETALAHVAVYKLGAIAVPLFTLFGEDALSHRLKDSGAVAVVTDAEGAAKIAALKDEPPALRTILCVDGDPGGALDFWSGVEAASDEFAVVPTAADDPALIVYTSGTTGAPKGALHTHRVLPGHMPGVELPHDFFPQSGDLFWTPADWAWIGGLLDILLPAWSHGIPVLSHRMRKFDPDYAFDLVSRHGVRNVFLPPTALKTMRELPLSRIASRGRGLRTVASGGESLSEELFDWGRDVFGSTINEFYGQTECNLVVGNCAGLFKAKPGSMGRAIPGHRVAIVDDNGVPLEPGETGNIGVAWPDPVMFLRYWNRPKETLEKFAGDWLLTGDQGRQDEEGYFHYVGRADDVITSSGYRIGPAEIENCLQRHAAVSMAAVIGKPDSMRTEIVKAFIVTKPGVEQTKRVRQEIQEHVKTRLAAYEYPREIEFVDALPLTASGKIIRRELRDREVAMMSAGKGAA